MAVSQCIQASKGVAHGVDAIKQRPRMLVHVRDSLGRGVSAYKREGEWRTVLMGSNNVPACCGVFVTVSDAMPVHTSEWGNGARC